MRPVLDGNIFAVVDVETTGLMSGYHEILQIAVVPLDFELQPDKGRRPFYINMAPWHPERQSREAKLKHGLDAYELAESCVSQEDAADLFDEWFMKLDLPAGKRLVPLAHNFPFERGFLTHWLGLETYDALWYIHPRDTMALAASINDIAEWKGASKPFSALSLTAISERLGVDLINAHDALADCLATAEVYRIMLQTLC